MDIYEVTWGGESLTVTADNPSDAWAAFCTKSVEATRHPNKYERSVVNVVAVPAGLVRILAESPTAPE